MTAARSSTDAALGMAWFNALTEYQRCLWLTRAGSAVPADAWACFKQSRPEYQSSPIAAQPRDKRDQAAHHDQHQEY